MAYPGPWIQGGDYTRNQSTVTPSGKYGSITVGPFGSDPYDDEMNIAVDQASVTQAAQALSAQIQVTSSRMYVDRTAEFTVVKEEGGGAWNANGLLDLAYYDGTYVQPTRPAEAIGVEYETPAPTLAGATLHVEASEGTNDSTIPGGVVAEAGASIDVSFFGGQTYGDQAKNIGVVTVPGGALSFDVDLTDVMGPLGELALTMRVSKRGTWHYYDPSKAGLIGANLSLATGQTSTRTIYRLHPPRHRWLYDTPQPLPAPRRQAANRIVQRGSDGLGMTGGRRIVQNRTVQSTNRRGAAIR